MHSRASLLIALVIANTVVILIVGLDPRGFQDGNGVTWIAGEDAIRFKGMGIAYTENLSLPAVNGAPASPDFRLSLGLTPVPHPERRGFQHIVTFYSGADETQLLIGQWRDYLIVMNGDDYDHSRRNPRLTAHIDYTALTPLSVRLDVNKAGSFLFLNGALAASISSRLTLAPLFAETRLLVGNSAAGTLPWSGDLTGLALTVGDPYPAPKDNYLVSYRFAEGAGRYALDGGSGAHDLLIPEVGTILEPRFFVLDAGRSVYGWAWRDWIINFLGFVPFGAVLGALSLLRGRSAIAAVFVVGLCAFLLSGSIELIQAWIPTRTSSVPDVLLNTVGALCGAAVGVRLAGLWRDTGGKVLQSLR